MPIANMQPYLDKMLSYWGPMMDTQLERAQAMPERESIAFDEWLRGKRKEDQLSEEEIRAAQLRRKMTKREMNKDVLSAAPKDPYKTAMTGARTQADAESYLSGRRTGDIETTRQGMVARTDADPSSWGPRSMGSYRSFGHQAPAAAMHGVDIYAGHPTGFDQYAKLAAAGGGQAEAEAGAMRRLRTGGGSLR